MIISAFVEVLLPVLVVVACGYALRRVFPIAAASTLVIVLMGALTGQV